MYWSTNTRDTIRRPRTNISEQRRRRLSVCLSVCRHFYHVFCYVETKATRQLSSSRVPFCTTNNTLVSLSTKSNKSIQSIVLCRYRTSPRLRARASECRDLLVRAISCSVAFSSRPNRTIAACSRAALPHRPRRSQRNRTMTTSPNRSSSVRTPSVTCTSPTNVTAQRL